jgi:hypothetical protein
MPAEKGIVTTPLGGRPAASWPDNDQPNLGPSVALALQGFAVLPPDDVAPVRLMGAAWAWGTVKFYSGGPEDRRFGVLYALATACRVIHSNSANGR